MTTNIPGPAPLGDKLRIAFLGPFGTFTEQAVHQVAPAGAILVPMTSAPQALAAVRRGEADRAVVPIENSIEGGVNATLDSLSHGEPLVNVAEMHVHVVFQLAVLPGTRAEDIRRIGTHPHAWAQCRGWVEETFPGSIHVPSTSTAAAAELLSDGDASFDAALCNAVSVNTYGLEALFTDVADNPGAVTRFVLVARPGAVPPPTGADKTTIQVALPVNESGALLTLLEQFSARGVDLSHRVPSERRRPRQLHVQYRHRWAHPRGTRPGGPRRPAPLLAGGPFHGVLPARRRRACSRCPRDDGRGVPCGSRVGRGSAARRRRHGQGGRLCPLLAAGLISRIPGDSGRI